MYIHNYKSPIQTVKGQLPSYESQFAKLFEHGGTMMCKMSEGDEAAQSMDQKLTSFEQHYTDLVTQDTGVIDTLAVAVKKVYKCVRVHSVQLATMLKSVRVHLVPGSKMYIIYSPIKHNDLLTG